MRTAATCGLAALVMTVVTPWTSANADPGDTLRGGCSFDSDAITTTGTTHAVIADLSASQEASGGPSVAAVACFIERNGVEVPGSRLTVTGNGVQAGATDFSFRATDTDAIGLCQQVTFADGSTWAGPDGMNPDCPASGGWPGQFPPQFIEDILSLVTGELATLQHTVIDPVVCPVLAEIGQMTGGGVAGIHIDPDGDVYVPDVLGAEETQVYDCPPYE